MNKDAKIFYNIQKDEIECNKSRNCVTLIVLCYDTILLSGLQVFLPRKELRFSGKTGEIFLINSFWASSVLEDLFRMVFGF